MAISLVLQLTKYFSPFSFVTESKRSNSHLQLSFQGPTKPSEKLAIMASHEKSLGQRPTTWVAESTCTPSLPTSPTVPLESAKFSQVLYYRLHLTVATRYCEHKEELKC